VIVQRDVEPTSHEILRGSLPIKPMRPKVIVLPSDAEFVTASGRVVGDVMVEDMSDRAGVGAE
jgi:hypothetical protein